MANVLVSGKIFRAPESRVSKAGKAYTTARIREGAGDESAWWAVIAFGDAAEELARLGDGDAIAVSGALKAEIYSGSGQPRISFSVLADRIISAHRAKKKDRPPRENAPANSNSGVWSAPPAGDDMNDEIPF